ncbi:glycosyltransferase family 4 protein [uncultured Spirosoma sp.]|uniref:glycosyltransferase family 4 protein n=1 Tax=uncultured Spirosoma sp. TaxID=278208 RepID=UPI002589BF1F|nr:glycosyltransferase family 4 protein [uncultured Spirosoma sp.]
MTLSSTDDKQKVLFLTPLPPPFYGSALSSQTCLNVLKSDNRFEVINIKINYSDSLCNLNKFSLKKIIGFADVLNQIFVSIKKFKPDLVYLMPATSGFAFWRDIIIAIILKMFGLRIIFHLRTRIICHGLIGFIRLKIFKYVFSSQKVILLGKELIADIENIVDRNNILLLTNAIEQHISDDEFNSIFSFKNNDTRNLKLLFLSNMIKAKGWPKALHAAKILSDKGFCFEFYFAGSWISREDEIEFYHTVSGYDLSDKVYFLGHADLDKKKELFNKCDVLIFPTEYRLETFGRVIIEAMEYGIPVIANGIGTIPSIIEHGVDGFVLEENTPTEIAHYIIDLANSVKRSSISLNARNAFLKRFTTDVFKDKFIDIIYSSSIS